MNVILVLPAYNEEDGLRELFSSLALSIESWGVPHKVVAVDDGSTDGTARVLSAWPDRLPLDIVRHEKNRGLGVTLRDGLRRACELAQSGDDVVVTMDADNTHAPDLLPALLERIAEGHDVVIASRYRQGARVVGLGGRRLLMCYGARAFFQVLFPMEGVRDYTSGYRAYRASALKNLIQTNPDRFVSERGFTCQAEILLKLRRLRVQAAEVPMVLRYDLKGGVSKMPVFQTIAATLRLALRNLFAGRVPKPSKPRN